MPTVEKSIEVNAPLDTVYNQWTQFEDFPRFMAGVNSARVSPQPRAAWSARGDYSASRSRWRFSDRSL